MTGADAPEDALPEPAGTGGADEKEKRIMTEEIIQERLRANGIPCGPELSGKLNIYFGLLTEWNARMDLVADAEEDELLDRHMTDSLSVLKTELLTGVRTLIDVGTGAGFPGMALALAMPQIQVTLLDSQQKRLRFLEEVRKAAGAENVRLVHARAEDGARKAEMREQFDCAAARAVAPLNVLCEYLLPYVRVGGRMLCWKGPALAEEMEAGRKAAFLLGGKAGTPVKTEIAGRDWNHLILPVEKTVKTPKLYPRRAGTPKTNPLGEA